MHKPLFTFFAVFLSLTYHANAAEMNMRPGLWQITTTSDLLWLAGQIPPDQMQSIKDLATEYGLDLPQVKNGAATSNACITQEMANQNSFPAFDQNQLGCTAKNATRTGNNYKLDFSCASNELTGNGTAQGSITSPENFSGQTQFDGVAQGNQPVNAQADINGKWIGASCGTVKPAQ